LYAANFRSGAVEVYDGSFKPIALAPGAFVDPNVPAGWAPFNVFRIGQQIYVTWGQQDAQQEDPVPGTGRVSVFNQDGTFVRSLAQGAWFNNPWAVVRAPATFGTFSNLILVGNFSSGTIGVFHPNTGAFLGFLKNTSGKNIVIPGLWGIEAGNGAQAGPASTLFFAAGPAGETQGLFGTITVAP
jgi:uncharacterized protein (TIGR03118 family)